MRKRGTCDERHSSRGVWVISPDKRNVATFDPQVVVREVRERRIPQVIW
jgi:hypothetical protein